LKRLLPASPSAFQSRLDSKDRRSRCVISSRTRRNISGPAGWV